jgi:hypothetical protein
MTRDFNNQRREDRRPDSRHSSPRRYGEERSPRPARPRLNRDTVDRAWENGARQNHADYRTRSDTNSHPPRDNRRHNQYSDQYSAQNSRNNRKPYGNRQANYRPGERTPRSNSGPRSFESGMRHFNEQSYNEHERQGYSADQPRQAGYRPGNRGNAQHPNTRSQFRDRDQYSGSQRREFDRDSRQPRSYDRDKRPFRNGPRPDTRNPRWQSRPASQPGNRSGRPQAFTRREADQELFEGDYEHFDASNSAESITSQASSDAYTPKQAQTEERHVTRLPDGRVLKGTQHEQRKNAEFWTAIAQESDELVQQAEPSTAIKAVVEDSADLPTAATVERKPKPRTHTASAAPRAKKTPKAKARQSTPKPRSTGPKPSQRGYKWPTPEG